MRDFRESRAADIGPALVGRMSRKTRSIVRGNFAPRRISKKGPAAGGGYLLPLRAKVKVRLARNPAPGINAWVLSFPDFKGLAGGEVPNCRVPPPRLQVDAALPTLVKVGPDCNTANMKPPRLTVLTTVHNRERYLDETIASVLAQDFADFEYVIVDDGSTDATAEILQQWAARDRRIVIERLPHNVGVAQSLNRGLAVARGEYIGKQDSDDICLPSRLRAQVALLDREPEIVHVSANFSLIDGHGRWAGDRRSENPSALLCWLLNFGNADPGAGCQGMFRREAALEAGGFCVRLEASIDYEFLTRLAARGRLAVLPITGSLKRLHPDQLSIRMADVQRRNSLATSRRMLTTYLQRELSDDEFLAVAAIWPQGGWAANAATGNRVMREAYAKFAATVPDRSCRRRARRIVAGRWALAAITLIRRGALREAARNLFYSMRWHPLGLMTAASAIREHLLRRVYSSSAIGALRIGLGRKNRLGSAEHIEHTGSSSAARNSPSSRSLQEGSSGR
jgi:glycosyltransferase involved in cell wall biosynthesis